jgi:hypothetical protein
LKNDEWDYIIDKFQFSGIPSYLIYDKEGNLKHRQTVFVGVENMQKWIDKTVFSNSFQLFMFVFSEKPLYLWMVNYFTG